MMSLLTYITGFFYELWTFTDFDRLCKLEKRGDEIKKIFSSETTEPISTKLCWNDPKVVPFHNYVRERRPVSKIAAITKNRNFFIWPKLLYFKPESAQNLNCISIMMSFLTYITGFLWTLNFCRFWPIMQIRKKGDGIKKNLLLWNYGANLKQTLLKWSLGSPLSKLCPWAPSFI